MGRPTRRWIVAIAAALSLAAGPQEPDRRPLGKGETDLSPRRWSQGELEKYRAIDFDFESGPKLARGRSGVVAATSQGGTSVRAGLEALRQGGSAVDAALATALTQISLVAGGWTSYAGILSMVVYDAETHRIYSLDAPFGIPVAETEPLTIPDPLAGVEMGRSALVPGFMAGAAAAHGRFGRLPWRELFSAAIYFADSGFTLTSGHRRLVSAKQDVLRRSKTARHIFFNERGDLWPEGYRFRQPELARTLSRVARDGADFMYTGSWARRFVEIVRADGGRITLEDLANYEPVWTEPLEASYGRWEIATLGLPSRGGVMLVEAMHLLDLAGLLTDRHYTESPRDLYRFIQAARIGPLLTMGPTRGGLDPARLFGDIDLSAEARTRRSTAERIWERVMQADWSEASSDALADAIPTSLHSDCVVAADEAGNIVAMAHTLGSSLWGNAGIFVEGVSISDAAHANRRDLAIAGPGRMLPHRMNPAIVLENGTPTMASAAVGFGLHEVTLQNLVNMLEYGLDPRAALEKPKFLTPLYPVGTETAADLHKQRVVWGELGEDVLAGVERLGQPLVRQAADDEAGKGVWVGLRINRADDVVEGGAPGGDAWVEALYESGSEITNSTGPASSQTAPSPERDPSSRN